MQTLPQLLPPTEGGLIQLMFIYQPHIDSTDRVSWYGGESSQLHYEVQVDGWDGNPTWIDRHVRTLGSGVPAGMSELHAELRDYYDFCNSMELEMRLQKAD